MALSIVKVSAEVVISIENINPITIKKKMGIKFFGIKILFDINSKKITSLF